MTDYELFKLEYLKMTGTNLDEYKQNQMKRRLDALVRKKQCSDYTEYLKLVKASKEELAELNTYITINVSEFFRNNNQWNVLESDILPELIKDGRRLRVWSAACSSGDEAYSLAMLLSKYIPLSNIEIIATDIDIEILKVAKIGEYKESHIRGVPKEFIGNHIKERDGTYFVSDEIKRCIKFEQHNLLKDPYPRNIDLLVCRNVMIYFTEDCKHRMYQSFSDSLSDKGYLFVGSTEQIISPKDYGLVGNKVFFYRKI